MIVDRQTAYESPVRFTPFANETKIDAQALGTIIDEAYAGAGIRPADIDTGVVILTGEALRRENAEVDRRHRRGKGRRVPDGDGRKPHGGDAGGLRLRRGAAEPRAAGPRS